MRSALAAWILVSCVSAQDVRLVQVASGFGTPTDIQDPGDNSGRLFLVAQDGVIRVFRDGVLLPQPFLNIRSKITSVGERGLLGLAFPPGFAQKQRFYVDYTDLRGDTVIAMYRVSSNPDVADAASETVLLHITQPFANHNGGQVTFGPDGYLYIAMGDGGSTGDPQHNGQSLTTLLGKILRIDVESAPGSVRIPADNPFVNTSNARPEIWAYGLRNPWRFSFDRANGDLWIADVGQNTYEEVDLQPSSRGGENYGWNIMEGNHCFAASSCNTAGLAPPIAEYTHADGCSISGGFVYRGRRSPGLRGVYFYGDYCSGKIWGVERQGNTWVNRFLISSGLSITTFGEDSAGELYAGDARQNAVFRIEGSLAPRFVGADVQNAASFAEGLTPGSLATVFAAGVRDDPGSVVADTIPLPLSLGGVSITIGGVRAPILSVSNIAGREQVNFQVPFEMAAAQSRVTMQVARDGVSNSAAVTMLAIQPGVFTKDGVEGIVIRLPEYQLVTSDQPLERSGFAYLYAEGLGSVSNQPPTGHGAPGSPYALVQPDVRVTLGGVPCEMLFAGLSPGLVGVYQVNFRVASNAPTGIQGLVVAAGGVASPAVKVFVR